ncbi:MAG: NAD(P)-dependent oxidoreductase [Trueperaceae bacterium]
MSLANAKIVANDPPLRRRGDKYDPRLAPIGVLSRVIGDSGLIVGAVVLSQFLLALFTSGAQNSWAQATDGLTSFGALLASALVVCVMAVNVIAGVYGRQRSLPLTTKIGMLALSTLTGVAISALLLRSPLAGSAVPTSDLIAAGLLTVLILPVSRWWSWAYRLDVKGAEYWQDLASRRRSAEKLLAAGVDDSKTGTVLVIGGAGYIGSALLPHLLDTHDKVKILDVFMYGRETIAPYLDHPKLEIIETDYRKLEQLVSAMQGVDTIIHLGGLVGDPACAWNEALTVEVNLTFTRVIAEVAKASGIKRFVFASTCSVYGASDEVLDEESPLNPVSLYARSKIGSERVLQRLMSPEFAVTILRFGTIYGFSGRTRFDLVVNLLTAKAHVDGVITVFGGDQWRPFVHVQDAAKAVAAVVNAPTPLVAGQIFNVGSEDQNATLGDVGRMVNKAVPSATYLDSGLDGDRRNYRVSFYRIRDVIGFKPDWTLEQGIEQVLDALKTGKVTDYRDPRYSNVASLKELTDQTYFSTAVDDARALIFAGDDEYSEAPVAHGPAHSPAVPATAPSPALKATPVPRPREDGRVRVGGGGK